VRIKVNGQPRDEPDQTTVAELLLRLKLPSQHVAVEVNCELVPRARHANSVLRADDRVEIVTLVGGG
jgi:sulfur carrier protein